MSKRDPHAHFVVAPGRIRGCRRRPIAAIPGLWMIAFAGVLLAIMAHQLQVFRAGGG